MKARLSNSKIRNLALTMLLSVAGVACALPLDYYAASSRLAKPGKWVKVKVSESGVQAIDHATLRKWGFDDPSKVRVYGFSGIDLAANVFNTSQPDDLPEVYSENAGERLFFYGEGDVRVELLRTLDFSYKRNYYSTYSCYFLSDADIEKSETQPLPFDFNASTTNVHYSSLLYEPEEDNLAQTGVFYFSKPLKSHPESGRHTFNLADYARDEDGNGMKAVLSYACVAKYDQSYGGSMSITITPELSSNATITSKSVKTIQTVATSSAWLQFYSPLPANSTMAFTLDKGTDNLDVTFKDPNNAGCTYMALDFACVNYTRDNRLGDNGQLLMHYPSAPAANVRISEASPATRVWDVTVPSAVNAMMTSCNADDATVDFTPRNTTGQRIAVFDPMADNLPCPELIGDVVTANLHADSRPYEMVIITTRDLLEEANNLANIHRELQGMAVKVVVHDDVYNEFSSGAPSAIAYHRYLKMVYDRHPESLRYALLFGHGTFDNRHLIISDQNYLQTYQVEEDRFGTAKKYYRWSPQAYTCDTYFGMLDDSFNPADMYRTRADIGVSRLPVAAAADGSRAIAKIRNYLADYAKGFYQSRALIIADDGDDNAHLLMAEKAADIIAKNRPATMVTKVYNGLYPSNSGITNTHVQQSLAQGVGYVGYSGHGDYAYIGSPAIFYRADVNKYAFANNPIVFLATCHGVVMDQGAGSVGIEMIKSGSGPIAVAGSGRQVYLESNPLIYNGFTEAYFSASADDCLGDIWRNGFNLAQSNAHGDEDHGVNNLNYLIIGDPALPVGAPSYSMKVNAVNSDAAGATIKVNTLEPITIEGAVTDVSGRTITSFNGEATLTLLDGQKTRTTHGNNDGGITSDIALDETLLAMTGAKVINGVFSATLVAPMGVTPNGINRLVMTATNTDGSQRAMGSYSGLSLSDKPGSSDDNEGPEISAMYLNDDSFNNGDAVGASPTLYATIAADPSGIAVANGVIGSRPRIVLDGNTSLKDAAASVRFNGNGSASLRAELMNLPDGYHTLTLDACDNRGNHSTRTIEFMVVNDDMSAAVAVDNTVVRKSAVFTLNAPPSANVVRFIIEDAEGNTILTRTSAKFPFTWTPAASLPEGLYRVYALLKTETRFAKTPMLEVKLIK